MERVREKYRTAECWSCSKRNLTQKVMETTKSWTPEGGPARAVISPLLSNLYLDPLDQQMAQQGARWCGMRMTLSFCAGARGKRRGFGTGAANGPSRRDLVAASGENTDCGCHSEGGL